MSVLSRDSRFTTAGTTTTNIASVVNAVSSTSLTEGSTWTGGWEPVGSFTAATIVVQATSSDKIGWLTAEFAATSAGTAIITRKSRIMDEQLNKVFMCPVLAPFMRVSFAASTVIDNRTSTSANSFTGLSITTFLCTQTPTADLYDAVLGRMLVRLQGYDTPNNTDHILAKNPAATISTFKLPSTNTNLQVLTTSTNNAIDGTGARTFLVIGLNQSYDEVYWKGDFVGTGTSMTSSASFIRVNDFRVLTYGSTQAPASTLLVKINVSATYYTIAALESTSSYKYDTALFTVPRTFTAYLQTGYLTPSATANTTFRLSTVKSGTLQPLPLIYNVACAQLEFLYDNQDVMAGTVGDMIVAEIQSTSSITISLDFVIALVSS